MLTSVDIDRDQWEIVKHGDLYRFVDYKNKLLSWGWSDIDSVDIENVKLDRLSITDMIDRYNGYF